MASKHYLENAKAYISDACSEWELEDATTGPTKGEMTP